MNNNERLGIIQELKSKNMQSSMRPGRVEVSTELDWKLAYIFNNYLSGKDDRLPSFEFIDKLLESTRNYSISMGYGIIIDRNLRLNIEDMIRPDVARVDVISRDGYKAYELYQETGTTRDIDIEKYPRFDRNRVEKLTMYIDEYHRYRENKREEARTMNR